MTDFELLENYGHEQLLFCSDKASGLKAIIAIHNTTLGPALGGTRMWNYDSVEDAVEDVLRLSRGMTYKASIAGLNFGGGKAVIIGDSETQKNELLFRTFGKFVEGLAGRYITAEDVGTTVKDMEYVRMETRHVTGISKSLGGSGDPAPVTAYGVYMGMKACANIKWGSDSLENRKIVVQGAGRVAQHLCQHLNNDGAKIYIHEINESKSSEIMNSLDAEIISQDEVYTIDADIFSPCALGAILNDETIPKMKYQIIAGAANNQLKDECKHGQMLLEKDILYAPDYVINAGGLMNVSNELAGYRQDRAIKQAAGIYDILTNVLKVSKEQQIPTHKASNMMAEKRLANIGGIKNIYTGK